MQINFSLFFPLLFLVLPPCLEIAVNRRRDKLQEIPFFSKDLWTRIEIREVFPQAPFFIEVLLTLGNFHSNRIW